MQGYLGSFAEIKALIPRKVITVSLFNLIYEWII